jgi:hypothetical protein
VRKRFQAIHRHVRSLQIGVENEHGLFQTIAERSSQIEVLQLLNELEIVERFVVSASIIAERVDRVVAQVEPFDFLKVNDRAKVESFQIVRAQVQMSQVDHVVIDVRQQVKRYVRDEQLSEASLIGLRLGSG